MNFFEAIKSGHSKTFQYSGRSSRSEYWWFGLYALISMAGGIFLLIPFIETSLGVFLAVVYGCYVFWIFLISLSIMTRRFHDIGYSGIWTFYYFLISGICQAIAELEPDSLLSIIVSFVPLLFFIPWCKAGQSADNKYGPNPLKSDKERSSNEEFKSTEGFKSQSQPIISEESLEKKAVTRTEELKFDDANSIEHRLAIVKDMLDKGLISEDQATQKRNDLLDKI